MPEAPFDQFPTNDSGPSEKLEDPTVEDLYRRISSANKYTRDSAGTALKDLRDEKGNLMYDSSIYASHGYRKGQMIPDIVYEAIIDGHTVVFCPDRAFVDGRLTPDTDGAALWQKWERPVRLKVDRLFTKRQLEHEELEIKDYALTQLKRRESVKDAVTQLLN